MADALRMRLSTFVAVDVLNKISLKDLREYMARVAKEEKLPVLSIFNNKIVRVNPPAKK